MPQVKPSADLLALQDIIAGRSSPEPAGAGPGSPAVPAPAPSPAPPAPSPAPAARRSGGDLPDLVVTSVAVDKPIVRATADDIEVTAEIENRGNTPAPALPLLVRLSGQGVSPLDDDLSLEDAARYDKHPLPAGGRRQLALRAATMPGLTHTVRTARTLPTRGVWHVGVTVDPGGLIPEADETNNTTWAAQTVTITDRYGNGAPDPRLGYTPEAHARAAGLDSQPLRYTAPGVWSAREILTSWSQVDGADASAGPDATDTDELRCGPTTAVAAAVMRGPGAVYQLARRLSDNGIAKLRKLEAGDLSDSKIVAHGKDLSSANGMAITCMTELAIPEKTTYGTLSRLAHATKIIMTAAKDQAATGHEMLEILALDGAVQPSPNGGHVTTLPLFEKALNDLALGEKYHVLVDTDVRPGHRTDHSPLELNHWVMIAAVGSSAARRRLVLYDPYPREGKQICFQDDPGFYKPFVNDLAQGGAFRGCLIIGKSGGAARKPPPPSS
jgi:hypothetical protein